MRRRALIAVCVAATATLVAACTNSDPLPSGDGAASPASSPVTLWAEPKTPLVTIIVQEALPEPVAVPGEDLDLDGGSTPVGGRYGGIWLTLPPDFGMRHDLAICSWTDEGGWASCSTIRAAPELTGVDRPSGRGDVELYLAVSATAGDGPGQQALRRLLVADRASLAARYRLREQYESVADVLTMQPDSDGNYLEVDE